MFMSPDQNMFKQWTNTTHFKTCLIRNGRTELNAKLPDVERRPFPTFNTWVRLTNDHVRKFRAEEFVDFSLTSWAPNQGHGLSREL